jgi:hypothetical protein
MNSTLGWSSRTLHALAQTASKVAVGVTGAVNEGKEATLKRAVHLHHNITKCSLERNEAMFEVQLPTAHLGLDDVLNVARRDAMILLANRCMPYVSRS